MFVQEKSPEDQLIFQMCDGDSVMQGGHCTSLPQCPLQPPGSKGHQGFAGEAFMLKKLEVLMFLTLSGPP